MWRKSLLIVGFIISMSYVLKAQIYHMVGPNGTFWMLEVASICEGSNNCTIQNIGPDAHGILSYGPDSILYALQYHPSGSEIYIVDPATGNAGPPIFTGPPGMDLMEGFVAVGGGIFYSIPLWFSASDLVYKWDINAGTVISIGGTGYIPKSEMTMAWGNIYYSVLNAAPNMNGILLLDISNPANSQVVVYYPMNILFCNLTASPICNTLIAWDCYTGDLVLINLIDGSLTTICSYGSNFYGPITSMLEFAPPPPCIIELDLDCNDSSGATDADYNSPEYDCLSPGVGIAD